MTLKCIVIAAFLFASAVTAHGELPTETLARLKEYGGSTCISGTSTALTVGGTKWTAGNEGVAVLHNPLPKPISILNVRPVDGRPLSGEGLQHLASAQSSRVIRFYGNSLDDESVADLVDALNASQNQHSRIQLLSVPLTDACVIHLQRLRNVEQLKISRTGITQSAFDRLDDSLPQCECEFKPQNPLHQTTQQECSTANRVASP